MSDIRKIKRTDWLLLVSCVVLAFMISARDFGMRSFGPALFTIVVAIVSIFLSYEDLKAFFFFYVPVGIGIHGVALIPLALGLALKSKQKNIFQFLFTIIILALELFHLASYSFGVDINLFINYALYIFLFFFILFDDSTDKRSQIKCIRLFIDGVLILSIIIIIHSILGYGINDVLTGKVRIGASFNEDSISTEMQTSINSNQLAYFVLVALALLIFVGSVYRSMAIKISALFILILTGLLTASRTWLLLVAILLLVYFLFTNIKRKIAFVIVGFLFLGLAVRYLSYSEALKDRYLDRFEDSNIETAGHRTEIFADYNKWLNEHPQRIIYGTGAIYYNSVCRLRYSIHNGTQQILVCYGILGLLLFLICIITFYRRYPKRTKKRWLDYMPFLFCLFFIQSGQFLNPPIMMLPFLAVTIPLKEKED